MESCAGYKYSVVHVLYPRERDIEMDGRVKSRSLSLAFLTDLMLKLSVVLSCAIPSVICPISCLEIVCVRCLSHFCLKTGKLVTEDAATPHQHNTHDIDSC